MSETSSFPPELQQKLDQLQNFIQIADKLEQEQRIDEAEKAYHACLQVAAEHNIPVFGGQLVQIWMGLGFCCADRGEWTGALKWYHRAEAVIYSAPVFNPNPDTPEAKTHGNEWSAHLPEGVAVLLPKSYAAEAHLAFLCDSIALAYDNSDQLERAQEYYHRSAEMHAKLDNPSREAEVWWHQAIGCQRREDWFRLEQVASKMSAVARRVQIKPMMLTAERLLAQSQFNQKRLFKTLHHLGQAVILGRELDDEGVETDTELLQDLIHQLRPVVLQRGQVDYLEPLVQAEVIINDVNLGQDKTLLRKWSQEQPTTILPGSMPLGALNALSVAAMVLEHFALRHCGASVQTKKNLIRRLGDAAKTAEQRVWDITEEEMQVFEKDKKGQLKQHQAPCAILTLFGPPEVIISVSLKASECNVMVMEERVIPGVNQATYALAVQESHPAQAEALLKCLNSFILRGLFVKTDKGLQFVSPKHS